MATNRTQTQDLAGDPAAVQAQAAFRDNSFLVRPSKIAIEPNDLASLSAKFAGLTSDAKIAEDDRLFSEGGIAAQTLQTTAEADRTEAQRKLAKLVRDGKLHEEYSPAFVIGFERATGRALQGRANNLIRAEIRESFAKSQTSGELGIPYEVPSLDSIITRNHDAVYNEALGVNADLMGSFYVQDEYSAGRAKAQPELESLYNEVGKEALKINARTLLGEQIQMSVSGIAGLTGKELDEYVAAFVETTRVNLVEGTVEKPFDFIIENTRAVVRGMMAETGIEGVQRAEEVLGKMNNISFGGTELGGDNKFQDIWAVVQQRRRVVESDQSTERDARLTAALHAAQDSEDADNPFHAVALADSPQEATRIVQDLTDQGQVALETRFGEYWPAILADLTQKAQTRAVFAGSSQQDLTNQLQEALQRGDDGAVQTLRDGLTGDFALKANETVRKWNDEVRESFTDTKRYSRAEAEALNLLVGVQAPGVLTPSSYRSLVAGTNSLIRDWRLSTSEALLSAPIEEHAAIIEDAYRNKLPAVRAAIAKDASDAVDGHKALSDEAYELGNTQDINGLNRLLDDAGITGSDREELKRQYYLVSRNDSRQVGELNWNSTIKNDLRSILISDPAFSDLLKEVQLGAVDAAPSIAPSGAAAVDEAVDQARDELANWLLTPEGMSARQQPAEQFRGLARDKAGEFAVDALYNPGGGDGTPSRARAKPAARAQVDPGDPNSAYGKYILQQQVDNRGMHVSDSVYWSRDPGRWSFMGALNGVNSNYRNIKGALVTEVGASIESRRINDATNPYFSYDTKRRLLAREYSPLYSDVAEKLGEFLPPSPELESKKALIAGIPFTPSAVLSDVSASLGLPDLASLSMAIRAVPSNERHPGVSSPYVAMRNALEYSAATVSEQLFTLGDNYTVPPEVIRHAMVAVSEAVGVTPKEVLSEYYTSGIFIGDTTRLDPGRVSFSKDLEEHLTLMGNSAVLSPLMTAVGLDPTSDEDRTRFDIMQTRLLFD